MNFPELVTVISFNTAHDAHMARLLLESNGIPVFVKDEHSVQINWLYSNAIGGIKLQVNKDDYEKAHSILTEASLIMEEDKQEKKYLMAFINFTEKIPWIKNRLPEIRILIFISIILIILSSFLLISSAPDINSILTEDKWCVNSISYLGNSIEPDTQDLIEINYWSCQEYISFEKNGRVSFPGIKSRTVRAHWNLDNFKLSITDCDTLSNIYNGTYLLTLTQKSIVLESKNTKITAHKFVY